MAHGITETDNMAYYGSLPWHGLGTPLDNVATAQEMITAANLTWKVEKAPLYAMTKKGDLADYHGTADYMATVRMDTKQVLGVVGPNYQVMGNEELFSFMDCVTQDPNGPKYHTAGNLFGGKRVWALAKVPECIEVTKEDVVDQYLLLSAGHDGKLSVKVKWTPIRVVCNNTLSAALWEGNSKRLNANPNTYTIKHFKDNLDKHTEKVQEFLGILKDQAQDFKQVAKALAKHTPSPEEIDTVLSELFGMPNYDKENCPIANVRATVSGFYLNGKGNDLKGVRGSAWALYNGVTEFTSHVHNQRGRGSKSPEEKLFERVIWGDSAKLNDKALVTIAETCLR